MVELAQGSIFADRYKVVRPIARGGMGAVYEVVHLQTQRRCALKIMLPHILTSERMRERFRQEACITSFVQSEFLVDVLDAGIDVATEHPFLVMELLCGEELKKRLARAGRMSSAEVVTCLHQVALALDKTHSAGIVHRDLKPDNIFLTEREDGSLRVKILDFGIAKILSSVSDNTNTTHEIIGTPIFMAPEQFMGERITPAADIYSMAMIAYSMLVGAHYWREELEGGVNALVFAATAVHGPREAPSVRARREGVLTPPAFDVWFARATATDPTGRFPTASSAVAALADALGVPRAGRAPLPSGAYLMSLPEGASAIPPEAAPASALSAAPLTRAPARPDSTPVPASSPIDPHTITSSSSALTMRLHTPKSRARMESVTLTAAALSIGVVGFLLFGHARLWAQSPAGPSDEAGPGSGALAVTSDSPPRALPSAAPINPPTASTGPASTEPPEQQQDSRGASKPHVEPGQRSQESGKPKEPASAQKAPVRKSLVQKPIEWLSPN
jgi:serine/threonine-protein kinase